MAPAMSVFVDTSALLAVLDEDDPHHEIATRMLEAALQAGEAFTHNYIHVEAERLVRRRLGAAAARRLLEELLPAIDTIWVEPQVHRAAINAVAGKGRAASLVDEVSFIVARSEGTEAALAFDRDFELQGFRRPQYQPRRTLSEAAAPYGTASDLVSVAELASRSGRSVNTIQSWRRRHIDFPPPNVELAAGPIWRWGDVSAWIDRRSPRSTAGPST